MNLEWREDPEWEADLRLFVDGASSGFILDRGGEIEESPFGHGTVDPSTVDLAKAKTLVPPDEFSESSPVSPVSPVSEDTQVFAPIRVNKGDDPTEELFSLDVSMTNKEREKAKRQLAKRQREAERRRREDLGEVMPLRTKVVIGTVIALVLLIVLGLIGFGTGFIWIKKDSDSPGAHVQADIIRVDGRLAENEALKEAVAALNSAVESSGPVLEESAKYPENKTAADDLNSQIAMCKEMVDTEKNPFPDPVAVSSCAGQVKSKVDALKAMNDAEAKKREPQPPTVTEAPPQNTHPPATQPPPTYVPPPVTQAPPTYVPPPPPPNDTVYTKTAGCLYGGSVTFSSSAAMTITSSGGTVSGNTVTGSGHFSATATGPAPISVSRSASCS